MPWTLVQAWIVEGRPSGNAVLGSYESWAEVMSGILEVAGICGFLGNKDRVYREAEQETIIWEEFCSEWWDEFKDRTLSTDLLFGLLVRHKLLLDVWGGRNDHSAHTRFGIAIKRMVDRVVGDFTIRGAGRDAHSKGQCYRLEMRRVRNVAEGFPAPDRNSTTEAVASQHEPAPGMETIRRAKKVPQPSATPRRDPWDGFLEDVDGPVN